MPPNEPINLMLKPEFFVNVLINKSASYSFSDDTGPLKKQRPCLQLMHTWI